jgi:hypothetical protein
MYFASPESGIGLGLGLAPLFVEFIVQPETNKAETTSNKTVITAIGFNCICLCKTRELA